MTRRFLYSTGYDVSARVDRNLDEDTAGRARALGSVGIDILMNPFRT